MKDQTRQIFVQAIAIVGFLLMAFIPFFQGKSDVFLIFWQDENFWDTVF